MCIVYYNCHTSDRHFLVEVVETPFNSAMCKVSQSTVTLILEFHIHEMASTTVA